MIIKITFPILFLGSVLCVMLIVLGLLLLAPMTSAQTLGLVFIFAGTIFFILFTEMGKGSTP